MTTEERTRAEEFARRVEEGLGYDVDLAEELGDNLGWFCLELTLVCEGEEFQADVDFNLSETGVEPLYAEITVDLAATERRTILTAIGERLISTEGTETYKYEPTTEELAPLLKDLEEAHAEIFG